jgi:mono/diheme cytochrome c family protein
MVFERYGLIPRASSTSSLPLGYTADDDGNLYPNCFACHGGKVAGRVIPGLANSHQDLTALVGDLAALRALRDNPPRDPEIARRGASLGFPLNLVRGSTNATQYSILLGAMRDRDLELTMPKLPQPFVHNSIDAPAWWLFGKKSRIYWDGMAPKTTRTLMQFTMAPGLSGATIRSWEEDFAVIRSYIESIEPPKYPFDVDRDLAASGRVAFERVCSECHGTYGAQPTYPERTVPLALLGTDPVRLSAITPAAKAKYNDSWFSNYGEHPVKIEIDGYVAPPLDGVWATGPYLHNGSVPTLWHMLHPGERPKIWRRTEDGFDQERVGLEIEELDDLPEGLDERQRRAYFDTRSYSHSNSGHDFPERLTMEERQAVLEYLKTL